MTQPRLVAVGAFVLTAVLLFAVALFMIGDQRLFFSPKFELYTEFARLGGLETGAPVRVAGMKAGEVTDIVVPPGPESKFKVRLEIRRDLQPLVRTDSVAAIQTEGLVGGTFLQVSIGSKTAPQAAAGATIPSREPFAFADLIQQMSDTVHQVNETVASIRGEVEQTIQSISDTVDKTDSLIQDVGADVKSMTRSGTRIAEDISDLMSDVKAGRGTVGKLFTDDGLYLRVRDIADQVDHAAKSVREAADGAKQAVGDVRDKNGPVQGIAADFRQTLANARKALSGLAENMEALKHNFFFRGFFKDRGYFDLASISPIAYRRGALLADGRTVLRVWIRADLMSKPDSQGKETLTDDGRTRLDSAMADFLRYRSEGPLMVEGYSARGTPDEQYVTSRARAVLAREYLVSTFDLDPRTTGFIALGSDAAGGPGGATWEGVALALYVDKTVLSRTIRAR